MCTFVPFHLQKSILKSETEECLGVTDSDTHLIKMGTHSMLTECTWTFFFQLSPLLKKITDSFLLLYSGIDKAAVTWPICPKPWMMGLGKPGSIIPFSNLQQFLPCEISTNWTYQMLSSTTSVIIFCDCQSSELKCFILKTMYQP